jgi:2-oxoglutarate dehydrogenase E2 component (dihydrolipoamide succinyltransferase)
LRFIGQEGASMAVDVKVPSVGESVTEGTLSRWLKPNGAAVRSGEPLCELETDKATQEVSAPVAGVLSITVPEGQRVAIGTVIGRIEEGAAPTARATEPAAARPASAAPAANSTAPPPSRILAAPVTEVPASPSARQLIAEQGLDARQITGTGKDGRINKEDVLTHLQQRSAPPPLPAATPAPIPPPLAQPVAAQAVPTAAAAPGQRETRQRMTPIRQRIAERLLAAQQNAAILTTFNEADMSAVTALRTRYKETFQKKHGVSLGFMSFFVKACIEALKTFPAVNARIDGSDIVYQHFYDIGVAVSTEKGLLVPVLRDADHLSFAGVEKGIAELAQKARDNKINVSDLQGGTFTITNGGVFGSLLSTPILNPPQSAILGMHAIQKRPVAINDEVVIRPMMYLALSYDHRLIDGREAAATRSVRLSSRSNDG